ncbi:hypothetical protein [Allosphingosinicella deserti]|uniref:Uncharacterized protein n=1 Tax=Allosphingosinicella deserti TaxID=2116704 RepID=A0A2P7QSM4_9SPHN|nr:hypothetical protein [Sphingomonas deserti]PSJ40961.1 hypothetical protein C7I55_11920 [Sphingomonas deserti]
MFGSELLEVAIGLIFLFFILSVLLSAAREAIEGFLQTRAIHLERGIRELLKDEGGEGLVRELYEHPLISSLYRGTYDPEKLTRRYSQHKDTWKRMPFRNNLPAYVPARNFALAIMDLAGRGSPTGDDADASLSLAAIREGASTRIADPRVRRAVLIALDNARGDLDQARLNLQAWFDSGMDRVSGWYRKETQWILLALGLFTAMTLNIDTLHVAKSLYRDDALRAVIVTDAEAVVEQARVQAAAGGDQTAMLTMLGCPPEAATGAAASLPDGAARGVASASCAERRVRNLGLPIGWENRHLSWPWQFGWDVGAWLASPDAPWRPLPGWLLTALAVSMGAPFWFDLLNKFMVIRSTVKPHEKSPEESSEDRQFPKPAPAVGQPGSTLALAPAVTPAPEPQPPSQPDPALDAEGPTPEGGGVGARTPNRREADEEGVGWTDKIDPLEGEP